MLPSFSPAVRILCALGAPVMLAAAALVLPVPSLAQSAPASPAAALPAASPTPSASTDANLKKDSGQAIAKTDDGQSKADGNTDPNDIKYDKLLKILFSVFVVATILESALAVIFGSKLFLSIFSRRALKMPISVVMGFFVANGLKLDIVDWLYQATGGAAHNLGILGTAISALVLAGGSSGVRNIMEMFGWRDPFPDEAHPTSPAKTDAWISVSVKDKKAGDRFDVLIRKDEEEAQLVGTLSKGKTIPRGLRWAFADPSRFPPVAGYAVEGGHNYAVILRSAGSKADLVTWGSNLLAPGAVIDIELTV